jgi:ubiquinone/menaquinone biosynthesis C-methylase UbiE
MITSENIAAAFDEVAPRYDFMVGLNPGYHPHLRAAADALVEWLPRSAPAHATPLVRLLDLGCGSGASTRALQRAGEEAGCRFAILAVDASGRMIERARAKDWPAGAFIFRPSSSSCLGGLCAQLLCPPRRLLGR